MAGALAWRAHGLTLVPCVCGMGLFVGPGLDSGLNMVKLKSSISAFSHPAGSSWAWARVRAHPISDLLRLEGSVRARYNRPVGVSVNGYGCLDTQTYQK